MREKLFDGRAKQREDYEKMVRRKLEAMLPKMADDYMKHIEYMDAKVPESIGRLADQHATRNHRPTRGWTQAPDLAMLKSRPVDPPRERDYAKLTEAAKRKEAPFVDWNGPSSDPCLKYAGIGGGVAEAANRKSTSQESDSGCRKAPCAGSNPAAAPSPSPVADSAVGEWPKWFESPDYTSRFIWHDESKWTHLTADGRAFAREKEGAMAECMADHRAAEKPIDLAWLESHGHAQVAAELRGRVVGEFEPVGTRAIVGDRISTRGHGFGYDFTVEGIDEYGNLCSGCRRITDQSYLDAGERRILKRKNVAARAWKYPLNGQICLLIGDHGYTKSGKIGQWADAGTRGPCQGNHGEEIHDPAEIQRLVAELHAAGLGEIKITPVL